MEIEFLPHALLRMKERGLNKVLITDAIMAPNKVEFSDADPNRFLAKKLYFNLALRRRHLLIIVFEKELDKIKVVTIIDTSKINKYY